MPQRLIGRKEEKEILTDALLSKEAELVAVIGRRRVGKTFLVNEVYKNQKTNILRIHFYIRVGY